MSGTDRVARLRSTAALGGLAFFAATCAAVDVNGYVRPAYVGLTAGDRGPLAAADRLQPGIVPTTRSGPEFDSELRASGHGISAVAWVQAQRQEGDRWRARGHLDELYASGSLADWQFSAGKKIVAWDVGYAFRPNDVVEQEPRRLLLETTPEGRPLVSAERFDASTAWSFVIVNPTHSRSARFADEPAFAARVYRRDGAVDWHGFARLAHARARASARPRPGSRPSRSSSMPRRATCTRRQLALDDRRSPRRRSGGPHRSLGSGDRRRVAQALVGGTWTNAEQVSLLAEAWWDGTASPSSVGRMERAQPSLSRAHRRPAPASAIAGNLAWQGRRSRIHEPASGQSLRAAQLAPRQVAARARHALHAGRRGPHRHRVPGLARRPVRVESGDAARRAGSAMLAQLPTKRSSISRHLVVLSAAARGSRARRRSCASRWTALASLPSPHGPPPERSEDEDADASTRPCPDRQLRARRQRGAARLPAALFEGSVRPAPDSHRGWDPGALELARDLAEPVGRPMLRLDDSTRLLVDLNRSVGHRALFSEVSRAPLPAGARASQILDAHYHPHRRRVDVGGRRGRSRPATA